MNFLKSSGKRFGKKVLSVIVIICLLLGMLPAGFPETAFAAEVTAVTGVTVKPEAATINVDDNEQLTAAVDPDNATNKAVTWSSDNETVASVDADGLVTGVSAGSAEITVTTADGGHTATSTITVEVAAELGGEKERLFPRRVLKEGLSPGLAAAGGFTAQATG